MWHPLQPYFLTFWDYLISFVNTYKQLCIQHNFALSERIVKEAESSYSLGACEQVPYPELRK